MSNVDFLIKLRDAACLIKDVCEEQLEKMAPPRAKGEELNFDVLPWKEQKGERGLFQRTDDEANGNSEIWRQLKAKLHEHNGFWQYRGIKYWFDRGNDTIIDRRKA